MPALESRTRRPQSLGAAAGARITPRNNSHRNGVTANTVTAGRWHAHSRDFRIHTVGKLGVRPPETLSGADHVKNNLPDVLARWARRSGSETGRARTEQSFCVSKADIVAQKYELSLNRYKEIIHEKVEHRLPLDIISDLECLESEIQSGLSDLKALLK